MEPISPFHVGTVDSLYVSPHADDAILSCSGRIVAERVRGDRVLLVTVFGPSLEAAGPREAGLVARLDEIGVLRCDLGLAIARDRDASYRSLAALATGWGEADQRCLTEATRLLSDFGQRCRARHIYVPLAVGAHVDHRIACEAGRAVFRSGHGRNVFLYEERPESLVRGAVRVRLGQLGARLPPAAAEAAVASRLAPFLLRFHIGPEYRGDLAGFGDRLRATGVATRQWRQGRKWHPLRALGPRLQPVLDTAGLDVLPRIRGLGAFREDRLEALAVRYARHLGSPRHTERYWLLLPSRDQDAAEILPEGLSEALV